jgi:hypothetical protein
MDQGNPRNSQGARGRSLAGARQEWGVARGLTEPDALEQVESSRMDRISGGNLGEYAGRGRVGKRERNGKSRGHVG